MRAQSCYCCSAQFFEWMTIAEAVGEGTPDEVRPGGAGMRVCVWWGRVVGWWGRTDQRWWSARHAFSLARAADVLATQQQQQQ